MEVIFFHVKAIDLFAAFTEPSFVASGVGTAVFFAAIVTLRIAVEASYRFVIYAIGADAVA